MSRQQDNKNILKEAFEIWDQTKGASVDHWMGIMADKVKFKSLADGRGDFGFTEKRHSREDMRGYFEGLTSDMEMIRYRVDRYIAEDDMVVAVGSTKWRVHATGKT
ncbi:MAG: nuclear transport factor 2 family protein, partial [Rhizobiales bacterium]|nr:nuclear transport factor 2 family protein [Hyphomicrobiales bacterium]